MAGKTFVGFGFGAIQAGLFLHEAHLSGNFKRLVVAEVMPDIVEAVRRNGGVYRINVAAKNGLRKQEVAPVEIFNSTVAADRQEIIKAIADADEICTALPSVNFYDQGRNDDIVSILSAGLELKMKKTGLPRAIIYTCLLYTSPSPRD